ncbi:MAG: hypothetical protein K9G30_01290 [Parvibaculum sp.]|nr:hypothetical protein [Parvibaculum sp.]
MSYLALAGLAFFGRKQAIQALFLSWLFTMLNPGIAPEASGATAGRYVVLFAAAASVVLHNGFLIRHMRMRPFTLMTILLGVFIIAHSLAFSPIVSVSVLKALSWTTAMATLVSAWLGLRTEQRENMAGQLFWSLVAILVVSLPLAVLPVGYLRNASGFQGILNHPQAFGPTMALLGAWAASRLFGEARPSWAMVGLAGACLATVLLSEARTAGVAMLVGVGLSVLLAPGFAGRSIGRMVPGLKSMRVWSVLFVVLMCGLALAPVVGGVAQKFISKSGRSEGTSIFAAYEKSRGILIYPMLDNIKEHPLTGIGFGIASEPSSMIVLRDPVLGLPVGASIEKGVVPLAVLEELGAFGAILVSIWVFLLLRGSARGGLAPFAVCLTVLLLNMGEATLFSPGGLGLLPMVLLGWTYASGLSREKT